MDLDQDKDNEGIDSTDADENHDSSNIEIEKFFDEGYGSIAFLELKWLLGCINITSIGLHARKIMELLQLCKIEKGSVSLQGKYTSLNSQSFIYKHKKNTE